LTQNGYSAEGILTLSEGYVWPRPTAAFAAVLRNASDTELYRILFEAGWDVAIRLYQVVGLPDHQATPHLQPDDFGCVSVGAHQLVQLPPTTARTGNPTLEQALIDRPA
jgi:hypothetical protein